MRGRLIEASKKLKPWRAIIAEVTEQTLPPDHQMILGPVRVEIDFFLPRPPSIKPTKRAYPIVPPDVDKLARGVLDAVNQGTDGKSGTGRLWADDSLVVELLACKFYDDDRASGAVIRIIAL